MLCKLLGGIRVGGWGKGGRGQGRSPVLWWVEDGAHPIHHLAATGPLADMAIKA